MNLGVHEDIFSDNYQSVWRDVSRTTILVDLQGELDVANMFI